MNWRALLENATQSLIEGGDFLEQFNEHQLSWQGFEAASAKKIADTEARLQVTLPPSYKSFLQVSNGFRQFCPFIWHIFPVEKIQWLRDFDAEWVELIEELAGDWASTDEEYFIYDETQDTKHTRYEYLVDTLVISDWGDAAILLLNPHVKFGEEWEAWFYAHWNPGADRYRSFEELMIEIYEDYEEMLKNDNTK